MSGKTVSDSEEGPKTEPFAMKASTSVLGFTCCTVQVLKYDRLGVQLDVELCPELRVQEDLCVVELVVLGVLDLPDLEDI